MPLILPDPDSLNDEQKRGLLGELREGIRQPNGPWTRYSGNGSAWPVQTQTGNPFVMLS